MSELSEITKSMALQKLENGMAVFSIANEGAVDRDGDMFERGSIRIERERATVASFQHGYTPVGTWTLSREGDMVLATAKFLKTPDGENVYEYIKEMGKSCQFSFRGAVYDWAESPDIPGFVFKDVVAFEASPVFRGAGDTKLQSIKQLGKQASNSRVRSRLWAILQAGRSTS